MKRLLFTVYLLSTLAVKGQDTAGTVHIKLRAGYALPAATQNIPAFINTSQGNSVSYEQVNVSLGKGMHGAFAVTYIFHKNIGMEFGLDYLYGSAFTSSYNYSYDYQGKSYISVLTNSLSANTFCFVPSVVMSVPVGKATPFVRIGCRLGSGKINSESIYKDDLFGEITEKWIYDKGYAAGFDAAIGFNVNVGKRSALVLELCAIGLSYAPVKGNMIESTVNGADQLEGLTKSKKSITYVKTYSGDSTDENSPELKLKEHYPFSSVGINVGWIF